MDKDKWLKKCSASTTDVEAATNKTKRVSSDDSVIALLKKQRKEIDEIANSLKEMSEVVKTLQNNSLTKADLEDILLKVKETPNKKVEPIFECCFDHRDAQKNNEETVFVRGFDCSFPRDIIRSTLKEHFSSCGEIRRCFVPIECKTGAPLGFAFINLRKDPEKALLLNGSVLGGLKLQVMMARYSGEYYAYSNFAGCKRCCMAAHQLPFKRFYERGGILNSVIIAGRTQPRVPMLDCLSSSDEEDSEEDSDEEGGEEAMATNHS